MNYALYLARRLSLSSGGRRRSPAIVVATTAVALSVAVMLAAVSVVGGFKREIREKVVGFNSHLTVSAVVPTEGESSDHTSNLVSLTPTFRGILDSEDYVTDYSLEAAMPAVLKTPSDFKGIYFKALEGETERRFIGSSLIEGNLPLWKNQNLSESADSILLSASAASQLLLHVGDKVDVYFISDGIRVRRMNVAGVFNTHFDAYDDVSVYGSKRIVEELSGISADKGTSLRINTVDFDRVEEFGKRLSDRLASAYAGGEVYRPYRVETAFDRGRSYFSWLSLLDTNVAVVLALMTVVGVVTLISGLLIIILDKISFVGVMKALGASDRALGRVFVYLALRVTLVGMTAGNAFMLLLLWIQKRWHVLPLDPESYYIDFVPVEFDWTAVAAIDAGAFFIVWISLILPSRFVARISPAETMRYE